MRATLVPSDDGPIFFSRHFAATFFVREKTTTYNRLKARKINEIRNSNETRSEGKNKITVETMRNRFRSKVPLLSENALFVERTNIRATFPSNC